LQLIKLTEGVA